MDDPHGEDLRRSYESAQAYQANKALKRRDTAWTIVFLVILFGVLIALAVLQG